MPYLLEKLLAVTNRLERKVHGFIGLLFNLLFFNFPIRNNSLNKTDDCMFVNSCSCFFHFVPFDFFSSESQLLGSILIIWVRIRIDVCIYFYWFLLLWSQSQVQTTLFFIWNTKQSFPPSLYFCATDVPCVDREDYYPYLLPLFIFQQSSIVTFLSWNYPIQIVTKIILFLYYSYHSYRDDWDSENLRACAYEAVNMIVTNSAEDMKAVVVQLLSEALNRWGKEYQKLSSISHLHRLVLYIYLSRKLTCYETYVEHYPEHTFTQRWRFW